MKICLITNVYSPYIYGGAEIYVEKIAKYLAKQNHKVIVITTKPYSGLATLKSSNETRNNVKIYRFFPLNVSPPHYAKTKQSVLTRSIRAAINRWNPHSYYVTRKILKEERCEVVHSHNLTSLSLSVFRAVKSLDLPLVHTLHDYELLCPRGSLFRSSGEWCDNPRIFCKTYSKLNSKIIGSPDIVTAPSKFVLDMHIQNGFFQESKIMKLPLGIELDGKKIEKDYETIDILYVGALSKHKGVHILINAFKGLESENAKLHILGKGKDEEEFKKIAGNDPRIKFYGFVPDEELMKFYQKANLLVAPSIWYDNSPMVIYESIMNGTTVIGSRIGGIPELVEDGCNGFLFEAGNVEELRDKLVYLIENPSELKGLEEGAFESVKKYDMADHIRKLEEIYDKIQGI